MKRVTTKSEIEAIQNLEAELKAKTKELNAAIEALTAKLLEANNVELSVESADKIAECEFETSGYRVKLAPFPKLETFRTAEDIASAFDIPLNEMKSKIKEIKASKPVVEMRAKLKIERY